MKKLDKKSLSKNDGVLDKLWHSVGKDKARCEVCETLPIHERVNYTQIHPHHIIGRGHHITRWDIKNRVWLCSHHHTLGKYSAHLNALWFSEWLKTNKPDVHKYLRGKQYVVINYSLDDLLAIYESLKEMEENGTQSI